MGPVICGAEPHTLPHILPYTHVVVTCGLPHTLPPNPPHTPPHRDVYEKGTAAMMTYTGILTDQLYHWWRGSK
uniref:Apolipoprotein C-II n=1 Tax=Strigops habroptila TaxID=2489341 RepID=A0A672U7Y2_STRHB